MQWFTLGKLVETKAHATYCSAGRKVLQDKADTYQAMAPSAVDVHHMYATLDVGRKQLNADRLNYVNADFNNFSAETENDRNVYENERFD